MLVGDGAAEVVARTWTISIYVQSNLPVMHAGLYPVSSRGETVVAISIEVEHTGLSFCGVWSIAP